MPNDLSLFFNPRSVAIIGASSNPNKLSFGIFRNLTQYGYEGQVYPINPNAGEILGLPCYPRIEDVPGSVDLAVLAVSARLTPDIIRACGEKGVKAIVVISGGFREVGEEGAELEQRCLELVKSYGMRMIGPNCVGTMDLYSGLNTTFIHGIPDRGHIGFLSQSGAICGGIVDYVRGKRVGFSCFASLGNEADVIETDLIEYLVEDPNTHVIAAYVEAIRDGRRFIDVAREVCKVKPVVILKAGKSSAGARAVSSHTGSIAGSMAAYHAAFKQSGVIEVESVSELFDVAVALDYQPLPAGKRVVLLTNSGGPAALASDSIAEYGHQLANLNEETQQRLRGLLNPSAQVTNPVDMLGGAEPTDYGEALKIILQDQNVDVVVPILVPQALIKPEMVARELHHAWKGSPIPMMCCFMGDQSVKEARNFLHEHGIPMYTFPESIGKVLGAMSRYHSWKVRSPSRSQEPPLITQKQEVRSILDAHSGESALGERVAREILQAYGCPIVEGGFASSPEQAGTLAASLGGKVVLKIVSPDLFHKSEVGGIQLGIEGKSETETAYRDLVSRIQQNHPKTRIEGVLVEKMAPGGVEVVIGIRRDPNFGPLLMFGLGGIYVELFKDVAFRIAPFCDEEALEMIYETKAGQLLDGFRGQPRGDLEAVVACMQKLSQIALDFEEISEIEINPLVVYPEGQGVLVLDCRVVLGDDR